MADGVTKAVIRHRLNLGATWSAQAPRRCLCGAAATPDHALVCPQVHHTMAHTYVTTAVRTVIRMASLSSTLEPPVSNVAAAQAPQQAGRAKRADLYTDYSPHGPVLVDLSVIHTGASSCLAQAAQQPGAAAALRDQHKRAKYAASDAHGYHFVPFSVESYGRLGQPATQFLNELAGVAQSNAADSEFDKPKFLESAYRLISVALCRGVASMYTQCNSRLFPLSGTRLQRGLPHATADLSAV